MRGKSFQNVSEALNMASYVLEVTICLLSYCMHQNLLEGPHLHVYVQYTPILVYFGHNKRCVIKGCGKHTNDGVHKGTTISHFISQTFVCLRL